MDRRRLLALLGGAALTGMTAASAQPQGVPTIGALVLGSPPPEPFIQALREGLREAGYVEGRNIRLEIRSAGGRTDRLAGAAAELVALKVDAIVSFQTPPAIAAKQATATIPIVMSGAGDPVGSGLITTMARPGGNVTGTSAGGVEIAGKSVELVPAARRIAVLANEIDAVIIQGSVLTREAVELATRHRLPSWSTVRMLPISGGLMSYAARFSDLHREAAVYVDKILKGAKPADLPVGFPSKFELVLNLKAARDLGVTIPETFLLRADELIE
jgi:putative ABC transport system substrate-binding protein